MTKHRLLTLLIAGGLLCGHAPLQAQYAPNVPAYFPPQLATGGTAGGPITFAGSDAGATWGADMVTNGTFTGGSTGWTLGSWSYGGNAVSSAAGASPLTPTASMGIVAGRWYKVTFTVSALTVNTPGQFVTVGSGTCYGVSSGTRGNGGYTCIAQASDTANLAFDASGTLTLDDVTCKPLVAMTGSRLSISTPLGPFRVSTAASSSAIGVNASPFLDAGTGGNLSIGDNAGISMILGSANTCVGAGSCSDTTSASGSVAVGSQSILPHTGTYVTVVGFGAGSGKIDAQQNVSVGAFAAAGSYLDNFVCVGLGACQNSGTVASPFVDGVVLGTQAKPTASGQFILGASGNSITTGYVGQGVTAASTPAGFTLGSTSGSGSNIAGGPLTIRPGNSTGTAVPGHLKLQRGVMTQGSGSGVNAVKDAITVSSRPKALADAVATTFAQVTGLGAHDSAGGQVWYTATFTNGTNDQSTSGITSWAFVNVSAGAGGETGRD